MTARSELRGSVYLLAPLILLALVLASSAQAATVSIPGSPMTIFVGDAGNVTARQAGETSNVFFSPFENDTPNAGFNLGFPAGLGPNSPSPVTYGVSGIPFRPDCQCSLTGVGTPASPYTARTVYKVPLDESADAVEVTQLVSYVNGANRFQISYAVRNLTSAPLRFRASEFADLYLADDSGVGIFRAGPPRLVGGASPENGHFGGIEEVAGSPWDRYEEGNYSTVESHLTDLGGPGLTNTINPADVDNGVAVQWDDYFASGLAPGATATFVTAWSFFRAGPQPTPPTQPAVDDSIDAQLARLPAPRLGRSVNVAPVKGTVLIEVRGASSTARAAQKGRRFVPLRAARQIPVGSLLDTSRGTVRLVGATARGGRQQGDFSSGLFRTRQSRSRRGRGTVELRLARGRFSVCRSRRSRSGRAQATRRSKRAIRRLRGNAKGRFRTRGRYSAATVRGTDWTVIDRCDGTLTRVRRGSVIVRDLRRKKQVIVRAGRSRLVRAPGG